ncbi:uncharacterized protein JCM15063_006223 [Sporobolomyces koalae]|uniref:uncharacterized protein n=1 Tax=Sporobolomyces koalae TaxID=500713 RepID=UPI003180DE53
MYASTTSPTREGRSDSFNVITSASNSAPSNIHSASTTTRIPIEPLYDSPERSKRTLSYDNDDDGQEHSGDLGSMNYDQTQRTRVDKGKGKAKQQEVEQHQVEELDEEAEERRVQENLAKWSKAESKRRASMRKNQMEFVIPTLPTAPLPPVPSASTIVRRTSTMIRNKSISRKNRRSNAGRDYEQDGGGFELRASTSSSPQASRRERRRESIKLDSGKDEPATTTTAFYDDVPPVPPLPSSPPPIPSPTSNESSRVSITSNNTGSRFTEDLPLASPRSSTSTTRNPFSPPITPIKNPFSDSELDTRTSTSTNSELDSTPRASRRRHESTTRSSSVSSGSILSVESQSSTTSTLTAGGYDQRGTRPRELSLSPPIDIDDDQNDATSPNAYEPRLVDPFAYDSRPTASMSIPTPDQQRRLDVTDAGPCGGNRPVRNTVGLLDWLLCGCWRQKGWDSVDHEDRFEEQQGRTNPME